MLDFTQDQWIIIGLIFVVGLFAGMFLLSGGGRKWKERYKAEVERRERIEKDYDTAREEWRERNAKHEAELEAAKPGKVDIDNDGIDDRVE